MDGIDKLLESLKDSEHVWNFQHFFGVRHVGPASVETSRHTSKTSPKKLSSNVKNESLHRRQHTCKEKETDSGVDLGDTTSDSDNSADSFPGYTIKNKFWYRLFTFGSALGDEMFYCIFFPFWFWNIDGAVGRRVMTMWGMVMYIGQGLKDIIRWPRPSSPPAIPLERKWALEYGMPSTHALVAVTVPFSVLTFTMHRYEYPFYLGLILTCIWCVLICLSRIYMGMHSIADVIAGAVLGVVLMVIFIPCMDTLDSFLLQYPFAPMVFISAVVAFQVIYPKSDRWTPARGDTAVILGSTTGCLLGAWANFQMGIIRGPPMPPPYQILWPSWEMAAITLLRTVIGVAMVMGVRSLFKSVTYWLACKALNLDPKDDKTKHKEVVEITCKYITYLWVGINITYLSPLVFRILGIERVTMHTEV